MAKSETLKDNEIFLFIVGILVGALITGMVFNATSVTSENLENTLLKNFIHDFEAPSLIGPNNG
jgi:hypothetical protein